MAQIRILPHGTDVVLLHDGKAIIMPWQAAREVAQAIIVAARGAEEEAKKDGIADDYAFALRVGLPVGLSDRHDIQQEALQRAMYDPSLRRYLPGGVESSAMVGAPLVRLEGGKRG